jgi:predicted RNase H-like HicB family nuclease
MTNIVALIHGRPGAYGISFPDLPGATAGGATVDEAVNRGREMLASYVDAMIEDGSDFPTLRSIEAIHADPDLAEELSDVVAFALVTVEFPGRSIRLNISMDETLIERIDSRAKAMGETRSRFLAVAARQRLAAAEG